MVLIYVFVNVDVDACWPLVRVRLKAGKRLCFEMKTRENENSRSVRSLSISRTKQNTCWICQIRRNAGFSNRLNRMRNNLNICRLHAFGNECEKN